MKAKLSDPDGYSVGSAIAPFGEGRSDVVDRSDQSVTISARMREIVKLFGRELSVDLNAHGITLGQWRFLRVLWERDGRSQKEIAEVLDFTPGATVFALRILERDGLAQRQRAAEDSRISRVYLTPKGRALERQLLPHARDSHIKALEGFSAVEVDLLLALLDRIKDNLGCAPEVPPAGETDAPVA